MVILTDLEKQSIRETADALAQAARAATLEHFRSSTLTADNKDGSGFDPVTVADRAAERDMREILAIRRPNDAILGEEYGYQKGSSGLTWVLDPIDGTRGYLSGTPTWGVLISIRDGSGPLYGVIDQPYIQERFCGGFGVSQMLGPHGGMALKTLEARPLSDAIVFTTFPEVGTATEGQAFRAVAEKAKLTRYGMDCYAYALLAAGQIDLVIEAGLQAYDIQAPIAVITAAGGVVTDWDGNPAHDGGRVIAAANKQQHEEALELIQKSLNSGE
ncbi:inositol monophosphatase family protein [Cochlodiniinecator piscidefendens]|uniref:inositol monophosphatase family protein n=1 Tax=Cochlodiniinecator piscidefendens TaxID=2715756 RepID=UPI002F3EEBDB